MAAKREKIHFASVEELLGAPTETGEGTVELKLSEIYGFENHPFKVIDDDKMEDLVQSIKENGVLTPVIVRPDDEGTYEMISGHRRLHAASKAGLNVIPAIIKPMTNDEAVVAMVDANVQREEILPSERAWSLKMKMDAMRRQGARNDLTSRTQCGKSSAEQAGEAFGLKERQVQKYIRLTNRVFIKFSIKDAMKLLKIGKNKAIKLFTELDSVDGVGLIERRNQGQGKPAVIYVKSFMSEVLNSNRFENETTSGSDIKPLEVSKANTNKNKYNNTLNELDSNPIDSELKGYELLIRKNLEIDALIERDPYERELYEGIYELVLETVLFQGESMVIASSRYQIFKNLLCKNKCLLKLYLKTNTKNIRFSLTGYFRQSISYTLKSNILNFIFIT